ncbi:DUF1441 family protein [Morganella psychrotolerans]|uniref:DUF1441 family protein n=1 Tax=Morganella psychrotolerans TaxID=368603 RepID=A0A1B8HEB5_9GAMM|nr:DUF1441 family protein [Morganella psychrotolerans]KAA8716691.1 DUF1441 family protein [Morganella psychrotolerans]OBU07425.1 terminase [Morganella psychrotolerans]OBU08944.1 terminase [Morganella psychrotolerans]
MSNISNLGDAYHWSVAKIAEAFGLNRGTVKKRLLDANVAIAGTVRGNPVYALRSIGPVIFSADAEKDSGGIQDPDQMSPKDRKDWFQSENERIKLETSLRQLIPAEESHREMATIIKAVAQVLDTWPDRLERDHGWRPEHILLAQDVVDELRDLLAAEVENAEDTQE